MTVPLLGEMVALFVVSVLIAYLCFRIHLVPIAGFLLAGVVIGPGALGLVADTSLIYTLAEIGVILLLFTIGAEFSLEKLARIKRFIIVGGSLQVVATVVVVVLVLSLFGVEWRVGVFTGFLVVLSSTAIVLKLLTERAQTDTPAGRVSLAMLIFQDLAMVMMVLLVPALSGSEGSFVEVAWVLAKAGLVIALVLLLARRLFPWLLEKVVQTRREELFLLTVVAACFGTAWITSLFGVSLALGAFLAGIVVSESRYSGFALSEILPLRTVFNAIFFVSIGMLLDLGFFLNNLAMVLAVAGGVLLLKFAVTAGTVMALGYPVRIAAVSGLSLAQICESSFVLERAGAAAGLTPAGLGLTGEQVFIAVAVLLMVATPFTMQGGPRLGEWLSRSPLGRGGRDFDDEVSAVTDLEHHVVVVGYGPAGQRLVQVMQASAIPFVVVELNPQTVERLDQEGVHALYGDASRHHILDVAGIKRAKLCVVVINDPDAVRKIVELARFLNPTLQVVVRSRFLSEVEPLQRAGADYVVPDEIEASIRVFTHVLDAYRLPFHEIRRHVDAVRSGDEAAYAAGGDSPAPAWQHLDVQGRKARTVTIRAGSLAADATLAELALRQIHGITVLSVRRNGETITGPGGDFRVRAGDRLELIGEADRFEASAHLFRTASKA